MKLDEDMLRVELARRRMTQLQLAKELGVPVTTLGSWVRGVSPPPPDLAGKIERALDLRPGFLIRAS